MVSFIVALGDAYVPVRSDGIPEALLKKLQPGKINGFLCLGNVGSCVIKVLKRVATDIHAVGGEDESNRPATQVIVFDGVRVGLVHGHLVVPKGSSIALDAIRKCLNVDVLVSGSTGRAKTTQVGSGLHVDPGSITGTRCSSLSTGNPSFSLLSIDSGKVTTFTYTLNDAGNVSFQRYDYVCKTRNFNVPATIASREPTLNTPAASSGNLPVPTDEFGQSQRIKSLKESSEGNSHDETPQSNSAGKDISPCVQNDSAPAMLAEKQDDNVTASV